MRWHEARIRATRYRVATDLPSAWRIRLMHCIYHKRTTGVHIRAGQWAYTLMIGRCNGP